MIQTDGITHILLKKRKADIAIEKFIVNHFDISLMNHNLTGKLLGGVKSIRVNYNIRIIFTEENGYTLVEMLQIDTYDERCIGKVKRTA